MSSNARAKAQSQGDATPGQLVEAALGLDERARVRLGSADTTSPEVLQMLAADESVLVRSAVALNRGTPTAADSCLTRDPDERVRLVLAGKLAALLPSLSDDEQAGLAQRAWDNLTLLVRDEAERVRAMVADLVKEMPDVPHRMILEMARDASLVVSDPVLRLSPALTQEDLLTLLSAPPAPHTVRCIAHRPALNETLCDAIVATADDDAIRCLLSNQSAAIRESTLDGLVTRAAQHVDWQEPLVRRPVLSPRSVKLLAGFVADRLLGMLATRTDLEPAAIGPLREQLQRRMAQEPKARPTPMVAERSWTAETKQGSGDSWRSEAALIEAIRLGESKRVVMMLAAASGVAIEAVQHAAKLRNAKAAVSLLWKGGFTMRPAPAVQATLFNLAPADILRAEPDGGFPLSEEEMRWQATFLTRDASAA